MSYEEFKKRIDTARNILVGAVPSPAGQIDQITYALMYKFMNDIDDQSAALGGKRSYFTGDYEKYNWHQLMAPSLGAHERLELYRQAVQGMAKNENLPSLFREIYQNAFLPFNSANVLTLFLKEIDKFNHGDSDDIGDAYEYLLSITGSQGDVGQFRTPRHIIKFIVEAVNPTKDDKVLDPAVGTAGFLIAAYNHVRAQHDGKDKDGKSNNEKHLTADELAKLHKNYRGFDIDPTMVRTASVNMYLHGFTTPNIINHDSLSSEDYWNDRYDVILANPPFMTPKGGIQPHKKFSISANRAEVLFVDYIASHLKPSGRAGIVVPEGVIFQSGNAYKQLRKNLVENYLYAVVSLPAGVFQPYSGVKTSILLLDPQLSKERDSILFAKVENDGLSLGAQRRVVIGNQFPEALDIVKKFQAGEATDSNIAHTVLRSDIAESGDYNLSGDRYKKSTLDAYRVWPAKRLGEIIQLDFGERITKKDSTGTKYPVYGGGGESFRTDGYNREDEYVIARFAMSENCVRYVEGKFWMMDSGGTFSLKSEYIELLDKGYVGKLLLNMQDQVYACARGGAQKNLKNDQFYDIKIPLPPIEIQREIVAELDGYQKIIDAAQTIVKTYKPTIKINPEWFSCKLPEIVDINNKTAEPEKLFGSNNFIYIDVSSVENGATGRIDLSNVISPIDAPSRARRVIRAGDTLVSTVRPNLRAFAYIDHLPERTLASTGFAVLSPKGNVDPRFLYYYVNSARYVDQLIARMGKGAYPSINTNDLNQSEVLLPPMETQRDIVSKLETERQIIDSNKKLIELYQQKIKSKIAEVWGQ